jgi:hypothetical protein
MLKIWTHMVIIATKARKNMKMASELLLLPNTIPSPMNTGARINAIIAAWVCEAAECVTIARSICPPWWIKEETS